MELKNKISIFREITLEIITALEKEDFDSLEKLINKRQASIEQISTLNYTQEEFKKVCNSFNILKLQQKLTTLMQQKQKETKDKINQVFQEKNASRAYNKPFYTHSRFLNKKI